MFNGVDYRAANKTLRVLIAAEPPHWRATIEKRWATFLFERIDFALRKLDDLAGHIGDKSVDAAKVRAYIEKSMLQVAAVRAEAEAYRDGRKKLDDPIGAEAALRLYYSAAMPRTA